MLVASSAAMTTTGKLKRWRASSCWGQTNLLATRCARMRSAPSFEDLTVSLRSLLLIFAAALLTGSSFPVALAHLT